MDYGGTQTDVPDEPDEDTLTVDDTIINMTRRLRCLFSTITWPIVPLGTLVSLGLLWVLYASFIADVRASCSHPLHGYAITSLFFVLYAPYHAHVRSYLFQYSRERDGPIRPARVRLYDQLFHTFCVLYVYGGVTLVQTCKEDFGDHSMSQEIDKMENSTKSFTTDLGKNTCEQTCPSVFQALQVYVTLLEFFTLSLILPLLFLPCIYLYILRRASDENGTLQQLQERLEEEDFLGRNTSVTAQELMDSLEAVQLISHGGLKLVPLTVSQSGDNEEERENSFSSTVKECCICMNDFEVTEHDVEAQEVVEDEAMVRTKCGHIFHKKCLAGWIGGRWDPQDRRRRRARRTNCPLCREELKPTSRRGSNSQ